MHLVTQKIFVARYMKCFSSTNMAVTQLKKTFTVETTYRLADAGDASDASTNVYFLKDK